jgi:rhamnogalacturonan endolyase
MKKIKMLLPRLVFAGLCVVAAHAAESPVVLFEDGFGEMRTGSLGSVLGAHAEYHYLPEVGPKGHWWISTFTGSGLAQRAWRIARHNDRPVLLQTYENKPAHTHPMVIGGDDLLADYTVMAHFGTETGKGRCGIVFRYHNDRCNYFFGVEGPKAVLKMVRHEIEFHKPFEKILASQEFAWKPGQELTAQVTVAGAHIEAKLNSGVVLTADDATYTHGQIGLVSDVPAWFGPVRVMASRSEADRVAKARANLKKEEAAREAANPKLILWKKFKTEGFGVGRNVRFGDLDGDGKIDMLFGQIVHHGPKDANTELSCLTPVTMDGKQLWQIGDPDPWKDHLTDDVAFQIQDLNGDGQNEVIYCMNMELIVADGRNGKTKYKIPTPETPANTPEPRNRFPRILGDAMYFCDFRGQGRAGDIVLKDRYNSVWAFDERLKLLWSGQCTTGHYPFAYDVDGDGKDELMIGYTLFDHSGKKLWSLDDTLKDHADGVAIVKFLPDPKAEPRVLMASSDEGMVFADIHGKIQQHHRVGHTQNPVVADFRTDLPGLETLTIDFWGNQGIVNFYDAQGNIYHEFEPCQHGSMCMPINWTGQPPEFWVLSPNVEDGGLFDGLGRRVAQFPADGHPEMCYAVMDLTGDCRDEIVVWDPYEVWVYTQSDNPKSGRLYKPKHNPLYNFSNYQTSVSLPGWSDEKR